MSTNKQEELLVTLETQALDFAGLVDRLSRRRKALIGSLACEIWYRQTFTSRIKSTKKFNRECDKLIYDSGMVSQNMLNLLLQIDSVDCTNNIELRQRRRALVKNIQNNLLVLSDALYKRAQHLKTSELLKQCSRLDGKIKDESEEEPVSTSENESSQASTSVSTPASLSENDSTGDDSSSDSLPSDDSSLESSEPPTSTADCPLPISPQTCPSQRSPSLQYFPRFKEQQRRDGSILVYGKLSGMEPEALKVSFDSDQRTITLSGEQEQDGSWFEKTFTIPLSLNMDQGEVSLEFDQLTDTFFMLLPRRLVPRARAEDPWSSLTNPLFNHYTTQPKRERRQPSFRQGPAGCDSDYHNDCHRSARQQSARHRHRPSSARYGGCGSYGPGPQYFKSQRRGSNSSYGHHGARDMFSRSFSPAFGSFGGMW